MNKSTEKLFILGDLKLKINMGRPPTRPARLRNGFYIEVKSQGSSSILIRRDTKEQMLIAAEDYARTKLVKIKGEMLDDKWVGV